MSLVGFEGLESWKGPILNRSQEEATHGGPLYLSSPFSHSGEEDTNWEIKQHFSPHPILSLSSLLQGLQNIPFYL